MNAIQPPNWVIAKQRIDDAQESVARIAKQRLEESAQNRASYEKFYNSLALLAGGTVALSVTYLGYLRATGTGPCYPTVLMVSWGALLLCLICAAFYPFFNTSYVHYARNKEYAEKLKRQHETLANEVPNLSFANISTKQQMDDYVKELREAAAAKETDIKWNHVRARIHEVMFRACAITARISFVIGLGSLLVFGALNIGPSPVRAIAPAAPQVPKTAPLPSSHAPKQESPKTH